MVKLGRYVILIERDPDSGWWLAEVDDAGQASLKGLRTQAKGLPTLIGRVRDLLALEASDARTADIEFQIMTIELNTAAEAVARSRRQAEEAAKVVQERTREAVVAFGRHGISVRDAGALLGVSRSTVQAKKPTKRRGVKRPSGALRSLA